MANLPHVRPASLQRLETELWEALFTVLQGMNTVMAITSFFQWYQEQTLPPEVPDYFGAKSSLSLPLTPTNVNLAVSFTLPGDTPTPVMNTPQDIPPATPNPTTTPLALTHSANVPQNDKLQNNDLHEDEIENNDVHDDMLDQADAHNDNDILNTTAKGKGKQKKSPPPQPKDPLVPRMHPNYRPQPVCHQNPT